MKLFKLTFISLFVLFTACLDNSSSGYDDTDDLAFLEDYAQQNGVTTTSSGLMYRVIEEGEGEQPAANQYSIITYVGETVDQYYSHDNFSTGDRFEIIKPEDLTSFTGLGEGVQLMKEGALYEFVLPAELATNTGRVFIIDLKLESVIREDQDQFLADNAGLEDINVTESGLQYRIIEEGDGDQPVLTDRVEVRYKGTYTSGYVFDRTKGNDTAELRVSQVIDGFSEGLQLMKEGAKYELFVSPELGYGENFPQYGETVLIFEVELVEIL